jgi:hypothetical protein
MLTIRDTRASRDCQGVSRRDFLRIGSLGMGGLTLPGLLAAKAKAASAGVSVRDRAVIFLFLQGGPSHIELFDPKMDAGVEIRSTTGEVATRLPGITFGGTFPQMADRADRLAIVRSYASGNADHSYQSVMAAGNPLKASMSAMYARVAGANHPRTGMPTNVLITPEAIRPDLKLKSNFETGALPTLTASGELGASYAAFNPVGGSQLKENMELRISRERFLDRRNLLAGLDRFKRQADSDGLLAGVDEYQQQAFDVITRGVSEAFDLSQEDTRTIERYDTTKLFAAERLNKFNDMYRSTNLLGHQLLMARRLCERGCGFVTVSDCGWDMHGNSNSLPQLTGIEPLGRQVDHAVSALIDDLAERGLTDKILLVVTGEMGRTPKINRQGGRDHYAALTSLALAGGGLKMGQVIGQSDRSASKPATDPYGPENLMATVMHSLLDPAEVRLQGGLPTQLLKAVETGQPIEPLFG